MTPELIDTHCHLTSKALIEHHERAIADAVRAGVTRMITVACRADDARRALAIARAHARVRVAAGIHPHEAGRVDDEEIRQIAALWSDPAVVAAGEMGLDYHYDFSPRDVQQRIFRTQLDLAREADLPIVIHCREAHDDTVRLLREHGYAGRRVVFHCFSGTADEAAELREAGWRTSFTGIITFKNAAGPQQACRDTPLNEIMFETDAPYLSPEPVRRMRPNEPQNVVHTIRAAAVLRGESFDDLAAASAANARRFYAIDDVVPSGD
jgi:TatD DNase family protein